MMHAGTLISEFDIVYTQRGHGRLLRENNTKLTSKDEHADLQIHERVVFCHILDMRENLEKRNVKVKGRSSYLHSDNSYISVDSEKHEKSSYIQDLISQIHSSGAKHSENESDEKPKTLQEKLLDAANSSNSHNKMLAKKQIKSRYGPRGKYKKR